MINKKTPMKSVMIISSLLIGALYAGYTLLITGDIFQMLNKGWEELPYIFLQKSTVILISTIACLSFLSIHFAKSRFQKLIICSNILCTIFWSITLLLGAIEVIAQ